MALLALWNPNIQFLKTDGTINAGGKLVVTDHNDAESIPANYSDADGTTLNASPIVLDALGRATCYIDDASTYDLYVKDANGATLWTVSEMTPGAETIVVRAGFSVSSSDSSVAVTISVDADGVTNYDLSIQDEIDRAKTAEKAAKTEVVAGDNITVTKTVGADGQDVYTIDGEDGDNLVEDVRVNGASVVTEKVANIDVPVAGTASPHMDGTASAGASGKYAREDHVHPSDTSREAVANKTTVVLGTSESKYPTDKAVWNFVNSSIATNTAYYISDNGEPFTSVAQLEAYPGIVTNNDYAFVTGVDSAGNTYYDRYKATVRDSTVTWALEYRLNNSSFTAAQWAAINSGITSALVGKIHEHSNKAVLDGITATDVSNWNNKLDKNGDGSDVTVGFTEAENRTNIATGSKLSTLFGQIWKWFADLKELAFKDKVGASDVESGTYPIDISGNAATAATLATPRKIDGVEFDGSSDIVHYGVCSTAYNVQAKVISCPGFVLTTGARIIIKFTQNNNFREPTFNVNDTGAVPVRYFGSILPSSNFLRTGTVYQFVYDGTNYCFVGNFDNNNSVYQSALSTNAEYPIVCKNSANQTAENNFVHYASGITMNPSTNKITASGGFVGNLSGNAATADSASTASSADIAGSTSSGTILANADLNNYNTANRNYLCNATNASTVSNRPSGASGAFELEVIRGTGDTCVQVYYSRDDVNFNYIRKRTGNDAWTGWVKLIDSNDTVANATTAEKLGSVDVGFPYMPIYLSGGTPRSLEGYFFSPTTEPSTRNLSANTTLNAVGGNKYVYNVSTSNTFTLTLESTASGPIAFVVRLKCTANCPNIYVTYNDAVEKATLTRHVYLSSGKMVDMCFTYYYGFFHLVSLSEGYYS